LIPIVFTWPAFGNGDGKSKWQHNASGLIFGDWSLKPAQGF
jgi:hypothetical protein